MYTEEIASWERSAAIYKLGMAQVMIKHRHANLLPATRLLPRQPELGNELKAILYERRRLEAVPAWLKFPKKYVIS